MNHDEIRQTYEQASKFFATNQTRSYAFRRSCLEALEEGIRDHEKDLYLALKKDLNKSEHEAFITELSLVYGELAYIKKRLRRWMRPKKVCSTIAQMPSSVRVHPEPYGVCLIMSPWNYPVLLTLSPLIGAIAAGNVCLLKPSAYSPHTSSAIATVIRESLPNGVAFVVEGGRAENETLLDLPFDYTFFTGSPAVGRLVMEKASRHLTPVTLELGGRSPVIVDESADIEKTAKRLTFGKLTNAGQTCIAPNHVFVHRAVAEALVKALVNNFSGTFELEEHYRRDYPRIVNRRHFDRLMYLLEGQKVAVGGRGDSERLQIEPTVLINPAKDSPVMAEEIFGPILPVITYDCLDDLIAEIKREPKPLALYCFTKDKARAQRVIDEISFGGGCINDCLLHIVSPRAPFGGVGNSGMGRYHGEDSFRTFSHFKTVLKKSWYFDVPLRYHPFTEKKTRQAKRIL
jgi:aldehyde dehydrogenase (NAD+)